MPGDTVRYSITLSNLGDDEERADRLQLVGTLPQGITPVPDSVRYIHEDEDGAEATVKIARNTGGTASRGHSWDASSQRLEIRLGEYRLNGGEMVVIEFEATVAANAQGSATNPGPFEITAHRVSKPSKWNNLVTATGQ